VRGEVVRRVREAPGELLAPMAVTADGAYSAGGWSGWAAWTGTHGADQSKPGTVDTTCDDWKLPAGGTYPTLGDVGEANVRYCAMGWAGCGFAAHLYCLQQ
jgi:hypothetical protein